VVPVAPAELAVEDQRAGTVRADETVEIRVGSTSSLCRGSLDGVEVSVDGVRS
jgi:hypothetical protein